MAKIMTSYPAIRGTRLNHFQCFKRKKLFTRIGTLLYIQTASPKPGLSPPHFQFSFVLGFYFLSRYVFCPNSLIYRSRRPSTERIILTRGIRTVSCAANSQFRSILVNCISSNIVTVYSPFLCLFYRHNTITVPNLVRILQVLLQCRLE